MLIAGLDIATSTGVCLWDTAKPTHEIRCLAIESEGQFHGEKCDDLAGALDFLLKDNRPDFCAIEMPQRFLTAHDKKVEDMAGERFKPTINPNAMLLQQLYGAAVGVLRRYDVPWGEIAPAAWRSSYFGKGFKPPVDWKQSAVEYALMQKIKLPPTKKSARDAAEAVGIARAFHRCSFIPKRHQPAFMNLRTNGRVAA